MARNRMIKPEFWSSKTLNRVSLESKLTFIGMWNFADDYGVLLNSDRRLLGDIYPLDEKVTEQKIGRWKQELLEVGLLVAATHEGQNFLIIKGWAEHQTVPNKSKRYHIEPSKIEDYLNTNENQISVSLDSSDTKNKEQRTKNKVKEQREKAEHFFDSCFWNKTKFPKRQQDAKGEMKKKFVNLVLKDELSCEDIFLSCEIFADVNKGNQYAIGMRKFLSSKENVQQMLAGEIQKERTLFERNADLANEIIGEMK